MSARQRRNGSKRRFAIRQRARGSASARLGTKQRSQSRLSDLSPPMYRISRFRARPLMFDLDQGVPQRLELVVRLRSASEGEVMEIDMLIGSEHVRRPPIDIVAEAMRQIAVGERCQERWDRLSEDQKEWWRECATNAIRGWMAQCMRPPY